MLSIITKDKDGTVFLAIVAKDQWIPCDVRDINKECKPAILVEVQDEDGRYLYRDRTY